MPTIKNSQSNRILNSITLFFLGLVLLWGGITGYSKDLNVGLEQSNNVTGVVIKIATISILTEAIRYRQVKRIFHFKLNNSQEKFAIYRDYEGYDDLESKIHKGDTLKVYFRHSNSPYNLHVFQLEKNREVLETFSDYKESSSTKVGLAFFLGILTLIYSVLLYNKMTVVDLLTFFVEGKKK